MAYNSHHEGVYLRVKRKREDEPATHMVAEIALPGAKKMRELSFVPGVFTYAETVEDSSLFDNRQYIDALNKRVTTLSHPPPPQPAAPNEGSPMSISTTTIASTTDLTALSRSQTASPLKANASKSYTIIPKPGAGPNAGPPPRVSSRPTAPPVVRSTSSPPVISASVTFYEAVESESAIPELEDTKDPGMDQFASMVNDYLQLKNIPLDGPHPSVSTLKPELVSPTDKEKSISDEPEDYVYDVFYFALKDVNDVNELMAQEAATIGTIHGLPYWEFKDMIPDDGSDESAKDEADEDSNDEDYYRNDYPDEEVSDEEEDIEEGWRHYQYEA